MHLIVSLSLGNGLMLDMQLAITWTNDDHEASLGHN